MNLWSTGLLATAAQSGMAAWFEQMKMEFTLNFIMKDRWKLLLKCRNDAPTRQLLSGLLADFGRDKENKGVSMFIDPGYDSGF